MPMPAVPEPVSLPLLFEPEFLPLARAYGYLRLAGVAPAAAAAAVSRLQSALGEVDRRDPGAWRRQLLADPVWSERCRVAIQPAPALNRHRWPGHDDDV